MKKSYKPKPNKDDLLGHYLAQSMPTVDFTKEEMKEKAVIGPYKDTIITVNQKLWMDNYNQIKKERSTTGGRGKKGRRLGHETFEAQARRCSFGCWCRCAASATRGLISCLIREEGGCGESLREYRPPAPVVVGLTVPSFAKRYPRICGTCVTNTQFDLSTLQPRSDIWMARFIEESYDEAYELTAKPISDERRRKSAVWTLGHWMLSLLL